MPYLQVVSSVEVSLSVGDSLHAVVKEVSVRCEFGRKLDQMGPQQVLGILETSYQIFNILLLQWWNSQWLNS